MTVTTSTEYPTVAPTVLKTRHALLCNQYETWNSQKNLKMIERRAGNFVESIAKSSMSKAAKDSFELEMEDVGNVESKKAQEEMGEEIDGLGFSLFHDASPSVKKLVCRESAALQSPEPLKDGTDVPSSSRRVKDIFKGRAKLKKRAPCRPSQ